MKRKWSFHLTSITCLTITIFLNQLLIASAQKLIPNIRPVPIFSTDTINKAENIILYNNAPLNTG
jgi:hypothetical protein